MKDIGPKKVMFFKHGQPTEVLTIQPQTLDKPGLGQVAVRLLAAPINPSDLGVIAGTYARLPNLPAVPGREGVGEIYAVGKDVDQQWLSKRVRMPAELGSWQDSVIIDTEDLIFVPRNIPIEMAAMSFINPPTAWCLLHHFVELKPGDWIVQNAANSAVGICVIQLAHHFGFKTINVVRDITWEEPLKNMGANVVVEEISGWEKDSQYTNIARLALNSVGGASGIRILKALDKNGVHVTFGGMSRDAVIWPTRDLIFRNITCAGFALDHVRKETPELYLDVLNTIFQFIQKRIINIPIEKTYPLQDVKKAVKHAEGYHRRGKILLISNET